MGIGGIAAKTENTGSFQLISTKAGPPEPAKFTSSRFEKSPDWVAVIAVTLDNQVVMVRQSRHGTGELSLEPPGGLVKEGQAPEQSAEELEEETGYQVAALELLGWMHPMPAIFYATASTSIWPETPHPQAV